MGFSLEGMFRSLEDIISEYADSPYEGYRVVKEEIEWWKKYAVQCGQLKGENE